MKKILLTLVAALAVTASWAQFPDFRRSMSKEQLRAFGIQVADTIKLWPNGTPSAYDVSGNPMASRFSEALLEAYPAQNPCGVAVVQCPGGAYMFESQDNEGRDLAAWFNARGIDFYMLQYRLPAGKYTTAPLEDAQEAIRLVRSLGRATKVGIGGASAGGHLASTAATHYTADSRPDFQILFYPVITMDPSYTHAGSRQSLLGKNPSQELTDLYSNEKQVTPNTPPAFIMGSTNDDTGPVRNFINYYLALLDNGVSASLHLYPIGGHGWGNGDKFIYKQEWTAELDKWLREVVLK